MNLEEFLTARTFRTGVKYRVIEQHKLPATGRIRATAIQMLGDSVAEKIQLLQTADMKSFDVWMGPSKPLKEKPGENT